MTHSAIHFTLGAAVATLLCAPGVTRHWCAGRPLATPLLRWLGVSYGMGLWAIIPALLRHAGLPATVTGGWWMNIFFIHPWLSSRHVGGTIVASACLATLFTLQYGVLVAAVWRVGLTNRQSTPTIDPTI